VVEIFEGEYLGTLSPTIECRWSTKGFGNDADLVTSGNNSGSRRIAVGVNRSSESMSLSGTADVSPYALLNTGPMLVSVYCLVGYWGTNLESYLVLRLFLLW
jgi:hypothetical protein